MSDSFQDILLTITQGETKQWSHFQEYFFQEIGSEEGKEGSLL